MSQVLFNAELGFSFDGQIDILVVSGIPGADPLSESALAGSLAKDSATGKLYKKASDGAGTDKWSELVSQTDINNLTASKSWREPVNVYEETHADLASALADLNDNDAIDGESVFVGMRLLLNGIATSPNVYIVSGSSGAWVLTESPNEETAGDTVQVVGGSSNGKEYTFNGTTWVWTGQSSTAEDEFIRAFVGKDAAGGELPNYSTNNYVTDGDTLETAIGDLDAAVKVNTDAITTLSGGQTLIQNELDATQTGAGLAADGTYIQPTGTTYIDAATSLAEADGLLDASISAVAGSVSTLSGTVSTLQGEVDAIETSIGTAIGADGVYVGFASTNYLDGNASFTEDFTDLDTQVKANADAIVVLQNAGNDEAEIRAFIGKGAAGSEVPAYSSAQVVTQGADLESAIGELDAHLDRARTETAVLGVVAEATIDSVSKDFVLAAKWIVTAKQGSNVSVVEILAVHDGALGSNVSQVDYTSYAKLRIGNITGLQIKAQPDGVLGMKLTVAASAATNVSAVREVLAYAV